MKRGANGNADTSVSRSASRGDRRSDVRFARTLPLSLLKADGPATATTINWETPMRLAPRTLVLAFVTVCLSFSALAQEEHPRMVLCRADGHCGDTAMSRQIPRAELRELIGPPAADLNGDHNVLCVGIQCRWAVTSPSDVELVLGGDGDVPYIHDAANPDNAMDFSDEVDAEGMDFTEDPSDEGMTFTEAEVQSARDATCQQNPGACQWQEIANTELLIDMERSVRVMPRGIWTVDNKPSKMICTGMTMPIKGSRDKGKFVPMKGGRVKVVGLSEKSEMTLRHRYDGLFSGQIQVTQDRVPVTMNFVINMTSKTTFEGMLSSVAHTTAPRAMTCRMVRRFTGTKKG